MFRYSLVLLLALGAGTARADSSAADLFQGLSRDFGAVPHGALLTYPFWLTNTTGGPVRIAGIRVSCGCMTAGAVQTELAPGQATAVVAQMDTRRFSGVRAVSIFVQFEQPRWEEVRLSVRANSRDDLLYLPETISFGQVKKGGTPEAGVQVSFMGGGEEQVVQAAAESKFVEVSCKELSREAGRVRYQVTARLRPGLPPGHWYTDVWLTTNSPTAPKLYVPLSVEVASP